MDEETAIINTNTRNEKIRNFFVKYKRLLISTLILIILFFFGYFIFDEFNERKKINISNQYNTITIEYSEDNKETTKNLLIELINKKDSTYSPLSLFFIIDNKLLSNKKEVNDLFDVIINEISMDKEIKNLIIYKKALYNADKINENELIEILKPIINSDSVWKSQSLYLLAEYFYSKGEKQKSKEFFNQILLLENVNQDLKIEAQKRLNRDLSE